jgi:pre-mRNA branch site protein p14
VHDVDRFLTALSFCFCSNAALFLQWFAPSSVVAFLLAWHHQQSKLPPEVNRILYVRNLPFNISAEDLYAIFGKYGAVYQIRLGNKDQDTRGTAFVVYEDIYDAKAAVDHLSGFNVGGRYLVVLYYQPAKFQRRAEADEKEKELQLLRKKVDQHKKNLASSTGGGA